MGFLAFLPNQILKKLVFSFAAPTAYWGVLVTAKKPTKNIFQPYLYKKKGLFWGKNRVFQGPRRFGLAPRKKIGFPCSEIISRRGRNLQNNFKLKGTKNIKESVFLT